MKTVAMSCQNPACVQHDEEVAVPEAVVVGCGAMFRPGAWVCMHCGWELMRCLPRPHVLKLSMEEAELLSAALGIAAMQPGITAESKAMSELMRDRIGKAVTR